MDETPFMRSDLATAENTDFPVRITKRAQRNLFSHIVNHQPYFGPCLRFVMSDDGTPHVRYCDPDEFATEPHVMSKFGRVKVGIPESILEEFTGQILDLRSFPPGPPCLIVKAEVPEGFNHPGQLTLSVPKLKALQPELFQQASAFTKIARSVLQVTSVFAHTDGNPGWIGRLVGEHDPDGQSEVIETIAERLWAFPADPAVVISTSPFLVSAYIEDFDHVMLYRLPDSLANNGPNGLAWNVGDRLIVSNSYGTYDSPSGDFRFGPKANGFYNECWCVLAEFITDDQSRLNELKAAIPRETWDRVQQLGEERREAGDPARDGRPWLSRVAIKDQGKGWWIRKGGYIS